MIIKKSIHFLDACKQIASNSALYNSGLRMLEVYKNKWEIAKTLVYVAPNGFHSPVWIDKYGKYVYNTSAKMPDAYPIVGDVEYINEPIEIEIC